MAENTKRLLASYGRRRGRRLRTTKQDLFDHLLPQLEITEADLRHTGESRYPAFLTDWIPACAGMTTPIWLEIGFGGGEHLAHQAAQNPNIGIIGCEPYVNGIAGLLKYLSSPSLLEGEGGVGGISSQSSLFKQTPLPNPLPQGERGLNNVRIYQGDARLVIERLPDASIERVFILYPDPWPKARHHKRRLVSTELLDALARIMKPGAKLRLATDDVDYCTWMLEHLLAHPKFSWLAKDCDNWLKPPPDWLSTRYEQKALAAGRVPTYLNFVRI